MKTPPQSGAPADPTVKTTKVPAQTCYCPAYKHPHRWGGGKCSCAKPQEKGKTT